jgi:hypothetical protein
MSKTTEKQAAKSAGDVVLQEIWRIKDTLSAACGHDVDRLFAEARERQKRSAHPVVNLHDRRVILISQFLVETCAGRSAEQLAEALSGNLADLDLAALRLLESDEIQTEQRARHDDKQLALFDKQKTASVAKPDESELPHLSRRNPMKAGKTAKAAKNVSKTPIARR